MVEEDMTGDAKVDCLLLYLDGVRLATANNCQSSKRNGMLKDEIKERAVFGMANTIYNYLKSGDTDQLSQFEYYGNYRGWGAKTAHKIEDRHMTDKKRAVMDAMFDYEGYLKGDTEVGPSIV